MSELGKPFLKIQIQNLNKNRKSSQNAAYGQKTTSEKTNFYSNIFFSLYFKIRAKKLQAAKPLVFFAPLPVSA